MIPNIRVHAWGWDPNSNQQEVWRDMIHPNLGLVQYSRNYELARPGDIAFVNRTSDATMAAQTPEKWKFAVLGDERNVHGPSGHRETPKQYMARLQEANEILQNAGIPTSSAGLAMGGGRFDRPYQHDIKDFGDYSGQNFRTTRFDRAVSGMQRMRDTVWFPTVIPLRLNWWPIKYNTLGIWLWQTFLAPGMEVQMRRLLANPANVSVGIWCLREGKLGDGHWQGWHGLIDRGNRLTWQGRIVKRLLEEHDDG